MKVPVNERALTQRINRKLRPNDEMIRTARWVHDGLFVKPNLELGRFFMIDARNFVVQKDVDIEELGRELGALKAWEELADED